MGWGSFLSGFIKFLDDGLIKHNINKANPPKPNLQTETSTPEIPESLTKNSELAWPHTPKNAEKYANIIKVLLS